jgi:hypothetical protein
MKTIHDAERIFIFGCSFTSFRWPTWADMIRYSTDKPFYNYGQMGIGNVAIMHKMVEADLKFKFTDKDIIISQWSTWTREDRYTDSWNGGGCVFYNPLYGDDFCKKWWNWNNDIVKNSTAMISANKMFDIDYQFTFYGIPNSPDFDKDAGVVNREMQDLYKKSIPNMDVFPIQVNTNFEGNCHDGHGDINSHLHFFNYFIKEKIGVELPLEKEKELINLHHTISNSLDMKTQNYGDQMEIIKQIVHEFDPTINKGHFGF